MRGGCLRQGQRAVDQAALRRTSPQQHRDAIEATEVEQLLLELRVALMPFDQHQLHWALEGWRRCGKGRQPVGLNLGDCFSCGLARALNAPLLFKGTVCTG